MGAQQKQIIHSVNCDANTIMVKASRGSSRTIELSDSDFSSTSLSSCQLIGKRVRFDHRVVEHKYPPATSRKSTSDVSELFVSWQEQIEHCKQLRLQTCKEWRSLGTDLLSDIHDIPVPERIQRMMQVPMEARGLEKEICSEFKARCMSTRRHVIQTVLQHQHQLNKTRVPLHKQADVIAQAATDCSHSSRCMARVLGLADQYFVRGTQQLQHRQKPRRRSLSTSRLPSRNDGDDNVSSTRSITVHDNDTEGERKKSANHEPMQQQQQLRGNVSTGCRSLSPPLRLSKQVLRSSRSGTKKGLKA